ncbi:hypothetical protein CCMA1212_000572 [Trichoderma ghanense]|uniref:Uncharacterized protein n=1 Tax=Trichoderma ghanense TaxID=65468 RepID=A0ABY2HJF1_9HYPO
MTTGPASRVDLVRMCKRVRDVQVRRRQLEPLDAPSQAECALPKASMPVEVDTRRRMAWGEHGRTLGVGPPQSSTPECDARDMGFSEELRDP